VSFGTREMNRCNDWVTSARPVASIDAGTTTTRVGGAVEPFPVAGPVRGVGRGVVRCVVRCVGRGALAVDGGTGRDDGEPAPAGCPPEPLLQPIVTTMTTAAIQKSLQNRGTCVDSIVMAAAEFYSEAPARLSRSDLEARVAELERVVATLSSLRDERFVDRRDARREERPDPVALTAALHPRGMRSARKSKRRSSSNGTIGLRFVIFEPQTSR
jgi:hypothetical protein